MPVLIVMLIAAILSIVLALQNTVQVPVSVLLWKFEGSLALVLLVAFGVGILVGLFVLAPAFLKRSFMANRQLKRIRELEDIVREGQNSGSRNEQGRP